MDNQTQDNPSYLTISFPGTVIAMSKDMYFMGIIAIIFGALYCLSFIGAAIGIPLIFAGIRLKESSEAFKSYASLNDFKALEYAIFKQQRFFYIIKVLTIVSIILYVLFILFYIGIIVVLLSSGGLENLYDSF